MNYTTKVGKPTAHITKKKSRLKVYNGHIVFLNDKDNFEFELHNPTKETVLAKIKLNGNYISSSGIVLRPGQRVFLERFLDTNNKFEFSTYTVEDNPENRSAIDLNGDVLVEFYDEWKFGTYSNLHNLGLGNYGWPNNPLLHNTNTFNSNQYFSNVSTSYGVRCNFNSDIETGRVEKGETSNQSFDNSYEQFNFYTSHTVKFKILPLNTKNVGIEEIRNYCTECGVKVKKNFKFCPSCGNKL